MATRIDSIFSFSTSSGMSFVFPSTLSPHMSTPCLPGSSSTNPRGAHVLFFWWRMSLISNTPASPAPTTRVRFPNANDPGMVQIEAFEQPETGYEEDAKNEICNKNRPGKPAKNLAGLSTWITRKTQHGTRYICLCNCHKLMGACVSP